MLIRYLNYSGASKIFLWVAEQIAEAGNDVTVYCFSNNVTTIPPSSIRFINEDLSNISFFAKCKRMRKTIIESKADVSISFLLDANVYNVIACMGRKTKSVICERNNPFKPKYYKLKFWKPILSFADGAVCQLSKVAQYYSYIKGKVTVIPNPITFESDISLRSFKERDNIIITVGRIEIAQKRNDIQIEAFKIFHQKHPEYKLLIYGSSTNGDDKKIMALVNKYQLNDSVVFAGVTKKVQESMKAAKIYLLTSDYEGIPNSLIEAMMVGLPCVSTNCSPGGASLLIKNGQNGFIVNKGDSQEIADKLLWLVEHPLEADNMGNNAKLIKSTFSEDKISKMWIEYLNQLTSNVYNK